MFRNKHLDRFCRFIFAPFVAISKDGISGTLNKHVTFSGVCIGLSTIFLTFAVVVDLFSRPLYGDSAESQIKFAKAYINLLHNDDRRNIYKHTQTIGTLKTSTKETQDYVFVEFPDQAPPQNEYKSRYANFEKTDTSGIYAHVDVDTLAISTFMVYSSITDFDTMLEMLLTEQFQNLDSNYHNSSNTLVAGIIPRSSDEFMNALCLYDFSDPGSLSCVYEFINEEHRVQKILDSKDDLIANGLFMKGEWNSWRLTLLINSYSD